MRRLISPVAICCFAVQAQAGIFNPTTRHYYDIVSSGGNGAWINAETAANARGGHLVTINDANEEAWLRDNFGSSTRYWIGFSDAAKEGTWTWSSGEPVTYRNWAGGEPNNAMPPPIGEDYAVINWNASTGGWNDWDHQRPDYYNVGGIAEFEPKTYAILVGSRAPGWTNDGTEIPDAVRGDVATDALAQKLDWVDEIQRIPVDWDNAEHGQLFATYIQNAVSHVASLANPGDTLLFYYAGHGAGGTTWFVDEAMAAVDGVSYSDHTLRSVLDDNRLDDVTKLVMLDACHSGGFWNDDGLFDKDLNHLQNIALIAAAKEDSTAVVTAGDGTSFPLYKALSDHLKPGTTYAELANLAAVAYADPLTGFYLDQGEGTVEWDPAIYFSPDFDATNWTLGGGVIPEPSTFIIWSLLGTLAITIGWWRRRRKA